MPVTELIARLDPPAPTPVRDAAAMLRHRDFLTVCLIVEGADLFPDNWIYVHDPSVRVGRIQNFKNWSPDMVPEPGRSSLGLEYFCDEGDALWTTPDAGGVIPEWHTLAQTDLGVGLEGAAGVVSGSHAFVVGGDTAEGPTAGLARANLAPQEPFFQLGLMGVVVPALQLQGETGQQIGYLNAATVGAVNFIALIIVGWAFNHQERVREIVTALRERRRKR